MQCLIAWAKVAIDSTFCHMIVVLPVITQQYLKEPLNKRLNHVCLQWPGYTLQMEVQWAAQVQVTSKTGQGLHLEIENRILKQVFCILCQLASD